MDSPLESPARVKKERSPSKSAKKKSPKKHKHKHKGSGFISLGLSPGESSVGEFSDSTQQTNPVNIEGILDTLDSDDGMNSQPLSHSQFSPPLTSTQKVTPKSSKLSRSPSRNRKRSHHMSSSDSDDNGSEIDGLQGRGSGHHTTTVQPPEESTNTTFASSVGISNQEDSESDQDVGQDRITRQGLSMGYKPPFNCFVVDFKKRSNTLWHEDVTGPDKELWLMSVPHNFDTCELMEKPVLFGGSVSVKTETDENDPDLKYCWEIHAKKDDSQNGKTVVLLPSKTDKKLRPAGALHGQMCVTKSMQQTPYTIPDTVTKRGREIPPGLKVRNIPFGAGDPVNVFAKRKKKSKNKTHMDEDSKSFQFTSSTNLDETGEDLEASHSSVVKSKEKRCNVPEMKPRPHVEKLVSTEQQKGKQSLGIADSEEEPRKLGLLLFAQYNKKLIKNFLKKHTIDDQHLPYVSAGYGPGCLKKEHPETYQKLVKRLRIPDHEFDELMVYLMEKYPDYLSSTSQVRGHVHRLEELTDFILYNMSHHTQAHTQDLSLKKKKKKKKHKQDPEETDEHHSKKKKDKTK